MKVVCAFMEEVSLKFWMFLLVHAVAFVTAQEQCSTEDCNGEGTCKIVNGNPVCTCVATVSGWGRYYVGKRCEKQRDHCAGKPKCATSQCLNILGSYTCEPCPSGYFGQKCDRPMTTDYMRNPTLHFNRVGTYGTVHIFLITFEDLGTSEFDYELYTDDYSFEVAGYGNEIYGESLKWTQSDDLPQVARSLSIRNWGLHYKKGYYYVARATFWKTGEQKFYFDIHDGTHEFSHTFNHGVYIKAPPGYDACLLTVQFPSCSNPHEYLSVDIERYNTFKPVVQKQCYPTSKMRYHWYVYTRTGDKMLRDYGETRLLKVPPYDLGFETATRILDIPVYVIQANVTETIWGRTVGLMTVARCYIFVTPREVWAYIEGSQKRLVDVGKAFYMDGQESRDFNSRKTAVQSLTYEWRCSSTEDTTHSLCNGDVIGTDATLRVPPNRLTENVMYTFNLAVRSKINRLKTATDFQEVTAVRGLSQDKITITCLRNCELYKYNVEQSVHLRAKCLTCPSSKKISYSWTCNDVVMGTATRVTIKMNNGGVEKLDCTVTTVSNAIESTASIALKQNTPPTVTDCDVVPNTGHAFETDFAINCKAIKDEDLPLSYHLRVGNTTMDDIVMGSPNTRLPEATEITVIICDVLLSCTYKTLPVTVTPLAVPEDLPAMNVLLKDLDVMVEQETHNQYLPLLNSIVTGTKDLKVAETISTHLNKMELQTLTQVEQMAVITRKLVDNMEPLQHNAANVVNKFLNVLSKGLENVLEDGEVKDIYPWSYTEMANHLTDTMSDFGKKSEYIIPQDKLVNTPRDRNNPVAEDAPVTLRFDVTLLKRIQVWIESAKLTTRCMRMFGVIGTHMHEPGDEPLTITYQDLVLYMYSVEGKKAEEFQTPDKSVYILLSIKLIRELQIKGSNLLLQVVVRPMDPYWWHPEQEPLSTPSFDFGVFHKDTNWRTDLQLQNVFHFTMNVTTPPEERVPKQETLSSDTDMPVYSVNMPGNSMLIVSIINATAELRVVVQLHSKPRGFEVRRSKFVVPATSNDTVDGGDGADTPTSKFYAENSKNTSAMVYIAVLTSNKTGAKFGMRSEVRLCMSFSFAQDDPQWSTQGCQPDTIGQTDDEIVCTCWHMSTFAGRVREILLSDERWNRELLVNLLLNGYMVTFYIMLIIVLLLIVWKAYRDRRTLTRDLYVETPEYKSFKYRNMIIRITTGSHTDAGTTANLALTFNLIKGPSCCFIIYQNPVWPFFTRNSTHTVRLPLNSEELYHPIQINVSHDNAGRYPIWYCQSIELYDLNNKTTYAVTVEQWINGDNAVQVIVPSVPANKIFKKKSHGAYKHSLEQTFGQWFMWEPLVGIWQPVDSSINRYQRTLIWITKVCMAVCIVASYFGPTTIASYEEERERFDNTITLLTHDGFLLFITVYASSVAVHYVLLAILLWMN